MLLGLDPRAARRRFAEIEEAADLVPNLCQCLVVVLGDPARQRSLFLSFHDILSLVEDPALREGDDDRARALTLLQQHGRTTIAFSSLGPGYQYGFFGDDAFVPFVDTGVRPSASATLTSLYPQLIISL